MSAEIIQFRDIDGGFNMTGVVVCLFCRELSEETIVCKSDENLPTEQACSHCGCRESMFIVGAKTIFTHRGKDRINVYER